MVTRLDGHTLAEYCHCLSKVRALDRMMDELNGDKERDYSGMDPKKASLLKKLQSKGLSFMGGESMDVNQLEQLVKAMDGVKGRSGEDL